jgi:signal-induced proliferation-associated 1 like protein 3
VPPLLVPVVALLLVPVLLVPVVPVLLVPVLLLLVVVLLLVPVVPLLLVPDVLVPPLLEPSWTAVPSDPPSCPEPVVVAPLPPHASTTHAPKRAVRTTAETRVIGTLPSQA